MDKIVWPVGERQHPDTKEFEHQMDNTPSKTFENLLSPEERLELSSLIGQLNWMSRQGRYDLSVSSLLQKVERKLWSG